MPPARKNVFGCNCEIIMDEQEGHLSLNHSNHAIEGVYCPIDQSPILKIQPIYQPFKVLFVLLAFRDNVVKNSPQSEI